jgi:cardiolipin synthase
MPRWLNLPNLVTLARLAAAPFIVAAIIQDRDMLAAAIFLGAAITDSVDGLLARRFGSSTRFGAYLDPIADKVFLSAVLIALAAAGSAPWWYAGIVFARDLLILLFAGYALLFTNYRRFAPSGWGKASTFFQIVTITSLIVRGVMPQPLIAGFAALALAVSTAVTLWSGADYAWRPFSRR